MAVLRREVFIASKFAEFRELRNALQQRIESYEVFPIEAINLQQNRPHDASPLEISLALVRRADVMVLLLAENLKNRYQLFRVIADDREGKIAARWACYFDVGKYSKANPISRYEANRYVSNDYNNDEYDPYGDDDYKGDANGVSRAQVQLPTAAAGVVRMGRRYGRVPSSQS